MEIIILSFDSPYKLNCSILFSSLAAAAFTAVQPRRFREFRVRCAQDKSTAPRLYHYMAYELRYYSLYVYFPFQNWTRTVLFTFFREITQDCVPVIVTE